MRGLELVDSFQRLATFLERCMDRRVLLSNGFLAMFLDTGVVAQALIWLRTLRATEPSKCGRIFIVKLSMACDEILTFLRRIERLEKPERRKRLQRPGDAFQLLQSLIGFLRIHR